MNRRDWIKLVMGAVGLVVVAPTKREKKFIERWEDKPITKQFFKEAESELPPGCVMTWTGKEAPEGWLPCDGRQIARNAYPRLVEAIGTRLPDLKGRRPFTYPVSAALSATNYIIKT